MVFSTIYDSDLLGRFTLTSDGENITGCWFENSRFFGYSLDAEPQRKDDVAVFAQARDWLDRYFAGERPVPQELPLKASGSAFQHKVWDILATIPYGQTMTYGDIAKQIAASTGGKMSSQAVGGAVGHNPIGLIVPCHRVMGAKGNLTGFGGGGVAVKVKILEFEGVDMTGFRAPKKDTTL